MGCPVEASLRRALSFDLLDVLGDVACNSLQGVTHVVLRVEVQLCKGFERSRVYGSGFQGTGLRV